MIQSMFHLPLPVLEKVLRPILVYLCLVGFLRLFGKRELAQLNPFDLVVLLSLANTVQNAMIGDDNSISGGVIGAFSLLLANWLLSRLLYRFPAINNALQGSPTVLIRNGKLDEAALKAESLTSTELLGAVHKDGIDHLTDVKRGTLEPNGTFYMERYLPDEGDRDRHEVLDQLRTLTAEVRDLRAQLTARA